MWSMSKAVESVPVIGQPIYLIQISSGLTWIGMDFLPCRSWFIYASYHEDGALTMPTAAASPLGLTVWGVLVRPMLIQSLYTVCLIHLWMGEVGERFNFWSKYAVVQRQRAITAYFSSKQFFSLCR